MNFERLLITFSLLYEQVSSASVDAATRGEFINLAAESITSRFKWSWKEKMAALTADGSPVLDLPEDFDNDGVVNDSLFVGDALWTEIQNDELACYSDDSQVYYLFGNVADGYSVNFPKSVPDIGASVSVAYYRTHPALVDPTDKTIIPDGECICNLAVGRFLKSEGEGEEALAWLNDTENGVKDLQLAEKRKATIRRQHKRSRLGVDKYDVKEMT